MTDQGSEAGQIKTNGWRQGSILAERLVAELMAAGEVPDLAVIGCWVTLSHDCDITNSSFEAEPTVEMIFGEIIDSDRKDGNKEWGKNSRLLQISDSNAAVGEPTYLEFSAHRRAVCSRSILASHEPSERTLDRETINRLVGWIAKRYVRRAFADTFNERTRKSVGKLRTEFKKRGRLISGVYLLVSDDELKPGEVYDLVVWVAMRDEDYEIAEKRKMATEVLGVIEAELNACNGIAVAESELRSEADVSITDVRLMKRWDFDDLTLREEGQDAIPRPE